jgi:putative ATP-dependent endonuclease of OLD family
VLEKKVAVVTDNDGKYETRIKNKYKDFDEVCCIKICASDNNDLETLEPHFVDANKGMFDDLLEVIGIKKEDYPTPRDVCNYMDDNKTDWALSVFKSIKQFRYPDYITDAIDWVHEG